MPEEPVKTRKRLVPFPLMAQVVVLLVVLFVLLFSSIFLFVIPQIQKSEQDRKYSDMDNFARITSGIIGEMISEAIDDLEFIASDNRFKNQTYSYQEIEEYVKTFHEVHRQYDDVLILDSEGDVVASATYNYRTIWSETDWFAQAITGQQVISSVYKIARPSKYVFNVMQPIVNQNETVVGVIVLQINMEQLWTFIDLIQVGESGFVYIEDDLGRIVAAPDRELILLPETEVQLSDEFVRVAEQLVIPEQAVQIDWQVVAAQPIDAFTAESRLVSTGLTIVFSAILFVLFLIASLFVSWKVTTIRRFSTALKRIQAGDLSKHVEVKTLDEFNELATVFNRMVDSLKESQSDLALLIERSPLGIFTIKPNGLIISLNPKMADLLGVEHASEIIGQKIFEVPQFKRSGLMRFYEQGLKGKAFEVEISYHPIGSKEEFWHHYRGVPIIGEDRKVSQLLLMVSDITERMQLYKDREGLVEELEIQVAERTAELTASQKKYLSIFNSTKDAIIMFSLTNGRIVEVNQEAEKMFGYKRKDFNKLKVDQLSALDSLRNKAKSPGAPIEWKAKKKNGEEFPVEALLSPIEVDDEDMIIASIRDVTERRRVEQKLKESESRYRAIIENTGTATAIVEGNTTLSMVNKRFVELSGYTKAEVEGKMSWTQFVTLDDLAKMKKYHDLRRKGGKAPSSYEFKIKNKRGEIRSVHLEIKMIPGSDQSIASMIDVTELEKTKEELKKTTERFEESAKEAKAWFWELNPDGLYTYASPSVKRVLGYKPEELVGKKYFYDVIIPEQREQMKELARSTFRAGIPIHDILNSNLTKDRKIRVFRTSGLPVKNSDGVVTGYRGVDIDVTEQEEIKEQLRIEKQKAKNFLDLVRTIIVSLNTKGVITTINSAGVEILGYQKPEELIGQDWFETCVPKKIRQAVKKVFKQIAFGEIGSVEYFENPVVTKQGETRFIAWHNTVMKDDQGKVVGTLSSGSDITQRKEAEQMKDDFINITTHELKTPLIPIKSQVQLLLEESYGKLTKSQKEALQMILENEEQLHRLLDDVIDVTKIRSKKIVVSKKLQSVSELISGVVDQHRPAARKKQLRLTLSLAKNLPKAKLDKGRIEQALRNLLENSIKFTPKGGWVKVTVFRKGGQVVVEVADSGIGMSKQSLENAFTPFFQASSTITRKYGGTGLGLTIVNGIIEAHQGEVLIASQGLKKGVVVTLKLPLK